MAQRLKVTFKRVNGDRTGYYTRRGPGKSYPTDGIHYMINCEDGKTFYCDVNNAGNNYYLLHNPEKNGITTNGNPCYSYLNQSFCSWVVEEYDENPAPAPEQDNSPDPSWLLQEEPKKEIPTATTPDLYAGLDESANPWVVGDGYWTSDKIEYISLTKIDRTDFYNDYTYLKDSLSIIRNNLNINDSASNLVDLKYKLIDNFDRWRTPHPDTQLTKSFGYVFFTRPDLNLYTESSKSTGSPALLSKVENDPVYYYLHKNSPRLLRSLTTQFSLLHPFNPFLSNMATSFELSDEQIKDVEHGETFTGYKVKYGRHNIESKTAGTFNVSYVDDNEYKVYKIHKAWVDYISKVYRGEFTAASDHIRNRILDYACSVYYFLCAEDGETILFWSKYTGVFPTVIPSASSSWTKGNLLKMPDITVTYNYAWKEDFNPISLAEFNMNGVGKLAAGNFDYISSYEPELLTTGKTFTGAPFVETTTDAAGGYIFKLKFRPIVTSGRVNYETKAATAAATSKVKKAQEASKKTTTTTNKTKKQQDSINNARQAAKRADAEN